MFLDSFSTNKLYRAELLRQAAVPRGHALRGPRLQHRPVLRGAAVRRGPLGGLPLAPGLGGERLAAVDLALPDGDGQRPLRIRAARLSDDILRDNGLGHLVHDRQRRFLRQDLRVYLNPLPARDVGWIEEFVSVVRPYLAELDPVAFETIDPLVRVCCGLILDGRPDELLVAARSLNGPKARRASPCRRAGAPTGAPPRTRDGRSPRSGWPSCPTAPPGCATRRSSPARAP